MSTVPQPSSSIPLACMTCGNQQSFDLSPMQMDELFRTHELKLLCQTCGTLTSWHGLKSDRRSGKDRRAVPQAHIELPVRVRCTLPNLFFIEVTRTLTASRRGASFIIHQLVPEDTTLHVVIPFAEGDSTVMEIPARVVHTEKEGDGYKVGVQFLI